MKKLNGWKIFCIALVIGAASATAQTFTTLAGFDQDNGAGPQGMALVQGEDGSLYGTTPWGGSGCNYDEGMACGTIFEVTPTGSLTTLYDFCPQGYCTTGFDPIAGLLLATDGNFYGSTFQGGNLCGLYSCGTIFRATPAGRVTTLYTFCAQPACPDGGMPLGLTQGPDGNLYGVTYYGGANCSLQGNYATPCGTVFRMTLTGTLTTIYSFCENANRQGCFDGVGPNGLVLGRDGSFYGTTFGGIGDCADEGCGTVFKITPGGTLTTLYSFQGYDGGHVTAPLIQGIDLNFYGTTDTGGVGNAGTVFRITSDGKLTTLHVFCVARLTNCSDGEQPYGGLIQATDGTFYGTTSGGATNYGTIYAISTDGRFATLHRFEETDGAYPQGALLQSTEGSLYGTTLSAGPGGYGTVFSLNVGLGPFVAFVQPFGHVGQTGGILGQGFTGTSSVEINGVPAQFKVVSDTYLTATVPSGATTGYVTVTTPTGVLTSNVPFRVIQ